MLAPAEVSKEDNSVVSKGVKETGIVVCPQGLMVSFESTVPDPTETDGLAFWASEVLGAVICGVDGSIVVLCRLLFGPSALLLSICRCGTVRSKTSKNRMPSQNPTTAGTNAHCPMAAERSIAGIRRLQTEAAAITPAANPVNDLCTEAFSLFLINNTQDAPNMVPKNGIRIPRITFHIIASFLL